MNFLNFFDNVKLLYIYYKLLESEINDEKINKNNNIVNDFYILTLNKNITKEELLIHIIIYLEQEQLIQKLDTNILIIYINLIDLLINMEDNKLIKEYINKKNIYNELKQQIINLNKIKYINFFKKYKLPNCIKIINNCNYDIKILYGYDNNFINIQDVNIIYNNYNKPNKELKLCKLKIKNAIKTQLKKKKTDYYINLKTNDFIYICIICKYNHIYNIYIYINSIHSNNIMPRKKKIIISEPLKIYNYNRINITNEKIINNFYILQK